MPQHVRLVLLHRNWQSAPRSDVYYFSVRTSLLKPADSGRPIAQMLMLLMKMRRSRLMEMEMDVCDTRRMRCGCDS